ncbi:TPA: hypothetical protein UMT99_004115 [Stenotrophomonas maltophilia]|uniref:hypothetical protein n=1 Tax=Stenotrophomonas TaxID=40323 RepID=UPI0015DD6129|nr:hypothetical protein [Stenotrophomonas maltophilia]ELC7320577.1 hypothetical protein [Stenotrophomonas maltophilia]HEL3246417.1 hypothetical protein [Stenotrophomonas maltophilia]HEL3807941.1 hypothetical protein [Stenotrophomonas maltophilia]HEL4261508.1 hypothetical protein [Stenotrophomonas maltophilia]HEL7615251.1 hypothetical protein [Stenotrophomonas maltophilia]
MSFIVSFAIAGLSLMPVDAHAQSKNCTTDAAQCSVAEAQGQCNAYQPGLPSGVVSITRKQCIRIPNGDDRGWFVMNFWGKNSNNGEVGPYNPGINWYYRNKCSSEATYTGTGPWSSIQSAKNGSIGCRNGCNGVWNSNSDGTMNWAPTSLICPDDEEQQCKALGDGYFWNSLLKVCEPTDDGKCPNGAKPNSLGKCAPEPCPEGMAQQQDGTCRKKENECPAGQVRSPDGRCLPGDGQCAKGEVRGPDGTCKKDSDDDGKPDEPGENDTFSGGDDCSVPPSCSGSPILCGQARIQWRIDCNTRKNRNIAGGSCAAMPVCTGEKCDAMEYAGLLMQWRTACAAEKLASQGNNNGGDGAQPEWTKVGGMSTDPGLGSSPDDTKVLTVKKLGVEQLDQSGFGGGGSCIGFAVSGGSGIGSGFAQAMASPPDFFCNYIILIRAVIILSAAVTCAFILTSGGKN